MALYKGGVFNEHSEIRQLLKRAAQSALQLAARDRRGEAPERFLRGTGIV
jgi:hypothetical protein